MGVSENADTADTTIKIRCELFNHEFEGPFSDKPKSTN
jgi:hypothetical protein